MNPRQCRRTFHLDRPDCRACTGRNTSCPEYEPAPDTRQTPAETEEHGGPRRPLQGVPQQAAGRSEPGAPRQGLHERWQGLRRP